MQFIFLLFVLYILVNLSARKDRINLVLNLQCMENTPFHTLWKYIYQGFIFSMHATNPTEFQVPYVSKDIYIYIYIYLLYIYAHLQNPGLRAYFVLWSLVFSYVSCRVVSFCLTNHILLFIFCEGLCLHSPTADFIDCGDCLKESIHSLSFLWNMA